MGRVECEMQLDELCDVYIKDYFSEGRLDIDCYFFLG